MAKSRTQKWRKRMKRRKQGIQSQPKRRRKTASASNTDVNDRPQQGRRQEPPRHRDVVTDASPAWHPPGAGQDLHPRRREEPRSGSGDRSHGAAQMAEDWTRDNLGEQGGRAVSDEFASRRESALRQPAQSKNPHVLRDKKEEKTLTVRQVVMRELQNAAEPLRYGDLKTIAQKDAVDYDDATYRNVMHELKSGKRALFTNLGADGRFVAGAHVELVG